MYRHTRACQPIPMWKFVIVRTEARALAYTCYRNAEGFRCSRQLGRYKNSIRWHKKRRRRNATLLRMKKQIARCVCRTNKIRALYIADEHSFHNTCFTIMCLAYVFIFRYTLFACLNDLPVMMLCVICMLVTFIEIIVRIILLNNKRMEIII